MGCLPLPVLFLLGAFIGRAFWGNNGMLWGSGIGLATGLLSAGAFIWLLRSDRNKK
ncbi:hypothetical protein ISP15_07770 [Dyella jejuensis]|uniref:AtpZ/AtpI family protein n=1 Tax=Dyella jejuensis TaxID=1432009 RepID=A0ABW8JKB3_9GAMM